MIKIEGSRLRLAGIVAFVLVLWLVLILLLASRASLPDGIYVDGSTVEATIPVVVHDGQFRASDITFTREQLDYLNEHDVVLDSVRADTISMYDDHTVIMQMHYFYSEQ